MRLGYTLMFASTICFLNIPLSTIAFAQVAPNSGTGMCHVDTLSMMKLSPDEFDQDLTGGWRSLAARPTCQEAAAALIKDYISQSWAKIRPNNLHALYWHIGQLEAIAGDTQQAVPFLLAGVNPDKRGTEIGFAVYALGTVAFLNHDLRSLKDARTQLLSLPKPVWYDAELAAGKVTPWPANLNILDNFIKCFGSSYEVAYTGSCDINK